LTKLHNSIEILVSKFVLTDDLLDDPILISAAEKLSQPKKPESIEEWATKLSKILAKFTD
jgi:hypothetical protein